MASFWDFETVWVEHTDDYPTFIGWNTPVNGTLVCPYLANGQVRKMVSTLSGLNHLNGQMVSVVQDGRLSGDTLQTVISNAITLSIPAAVVHVGLPYIGK